MASARSVVIGSMALTRSGLNGRCAQSSSFIGSLFAGTRQYRQLSLSCMRKRRGRKSSSVVVIAELSGQYEDAFEDVDQERQDHAERVMITRLHLYDNGSRNVTTRRCMRESHRRICSSCVSVCWRLSFGRPTTQQQRKLVTCNN